MNCTNRVCPYCEEIVRSERGDCCGEVHAQECGSDERVYCSECREREEAKWAAHFGLRRVMSKVDRAVQLARMNPYRATDEEMDAWRRLK